MKTREKNIWLLGKTPNCRRLFLVPTHKNTHLVPWDSKTDIPITRRAGEEIQFEHPEIKLKTFQPRHILFQIPWLSFPMSWSEKYYRLGFVILLLPLILVLAFKFSRLGLGEQLWPKPRTPLKHDVLASSTQEDVKLPQPIDGAHQEGQLVMAEPDSPSRLHVKTDEKTREAPVTKKSIESKESRKPSPPRSSKIKQEKIKKAMRKEKEPQKKKTRSVASENKATRKKKKSRKWTPVKKKMHAALLQGDFDRVDSLLSTYRSSHRGRLPMDLKRIWAEGQYARCRRSMDQKAFRSAWISCEAAASVENHARAMEILSRLQELARQKYLEGYAMERTRPEAALSRYKEILDFVPKGNQFRQKASKKIKQFQ